MRIAVIGTGYVGLVTGSGFSEFGHDVTCVDIDAARVAALEDGKVPFFEPGLPELVRRNVAVNRLKFTTSIADAVDGAQLAFIAVGTPSGPDGSADLSYVDAAARDIGRALTNFAVVVTKSTVPVGTAERVRAAVASTAKHPFAVASNPEFLKEGDAVNDFLKPARVIVGVDDPRAEELLRELYRGVLLTNDRVQVMDIRSAELTKYAANAMLATRISFMNELARLCELVGGDIDAVRKGIGADPRIGNKFLFAGAGFGGSCFPKDIRALAHTAREAGTQLEVVEAVHRANERQKRVLGERVVSVLGNDLRGKKVAIWGLAFKPETDDIRESPALTLIDQLSTAGAALAGYDPEASANIAARVGTKIELVQEPYAATAGADALVLVTEWHALRTLDIAKLSKLMRGRLVLDGRNVWPADELRKAGFVYHGIGRAANVRH